MLKELEDLDKKVNMPKQKQIIDLYQIAWFEQFFNDVVKTSFERYPEDRIATWNYDLKYLRQLLVSESNINQVSHMQAPTNFLPSNFVPNTSDMHTIYYPELDLAVKENKYICDHNPDDEVYSLTTLFSQIEVCKDGWYTSNSLKIEDIDNPYFALMYEIARRKHFDDLLMD